MILSVDFGASTTDAVLLGGKKIIKTASTPKLLRTKKEIEDFLKKNNFSKRGIDTVAITGGKSSFFRQKIFGFQPKHVNEIEAIGNGAAFLAKKKRCLAVSMGTGTCLVFFNNGKSKHVIGSGVGGGTVLGLSHLLLKQKKIAALDALARKGKLSRVDLSVRDIVGKSIGIVAANATASNFAKLKNFSKADIAAAIQNLVAESVAVLAVSASNSCNCDLIVFCGKTAKFSFVRKRLNVAARLFGKRFLFPARFDFATAVGAALAAKKQE